MSNLPGEMWNVQLCVDTMDSHLAPSASVCVCVCVYFKPCLLFDFIGETLHNVFSGFCNFEHRDYMSVLSNYCNHHYMGP